MRLAILLSTVLLMLRISALAQGEPQKLAEGKYLMTANGQPGQTQQWTLWRRPDGSYQLENHFHIANEAAEVVAALGPGHLSRELKAELQHESSQEGLTLTTDSQFQPLELLLTGVRLMEHKQVELAHCQVIPDSVRCKGADGSAKRSFSSAHDFFFSFPFPLLLRPLLLKYALKPNDAATTTLVVLKVGSAGPSLSESDAQFKCWGNDVIFLGDRKFAATKYTLDLHSPKDPLHLTFWTAKRAMVLAMDAVELPGQRLVLTDYQAYGDF